MKFYTARQCRFHAVRLVPGQDLKQELQSLTLAAGIQAGFVISAVGSLTRVALRLANRKDCTQMDGHFEILSLNGTLSPHGVHLHLSVSDGAGNVTGGHLMEGCEVFTTVELVAGEAVDLIFQRKTDERTTYKELVIRRAK
jgi:hypothetical protein